MKFTRLMPGQIAVEMSNEEFMDLLNKQRSEKLRAEGFKADAAERNGDKWVIMFKKGGGLPSFSRGPEWDRMKASLKK